LATVLLIVTASRSAFAVEIFADGFEECGLGHWATPTLTAPPEAFSVTAALLAETIGACAPSLVSADFRLADGSVPDATALVQMGNSQSAVMRSFGTGGISARAGGTMVAISSGKARDEDGPDFTDPTVGTTFSRAGNAPASYLAAHDDVLPSGACPGGRSSANDSIALRLVLQVPQDATALRFDWTFASADYPDYLCNGGSQFVDFFLALVQGSSPDLPADGNVALVGGNPVSAVFVPFDYCSGCPNGTGGLTGTGYTGHAITDWHTAEIPVVGGETITLDLMTFDVGDWVVDSVVLLDGMRWVKGG